MKIRDKEVVVVLIVVAIERNSCLFINYNYCLRGDLFVYVCVSVCLRVRVSQVDQNHHNSSMLETQSSQASKEFCNC